MSSSSYSTEYFLRKTRSSTQRKRVYGEMRDKQVLIDHTQRKVTIQHKITSVPKGRLVILKPRVQIVVETGAGHIVHNTRKKRKRKGYSILLRQQIAYNTKNTITKYHLKYYRSFIEHATRTVMNRFTAFTRRTENAKQKTLIIWVSYGQLCP